MEHRTLQNVVPFPHACQSSLQSVCIIHYQIHLFLTVPFLFAKKIEMEFDFFFTGTHTHTLFLDSAVNAGLNDTAGKLNRIRFQAGNCIWKLVKFGRINYNVWDLLTIATFYS